MGFLSQLGTAIGGAVGTVVAPGAGTAGGAAAGGAIGGFFERPDQPCADQPDAGLVRAAQQLAPASVRGELARLYASANNGAAPPSDPAALARACVGGSDCVASSAAGQALKRYFLEAFIPYGRAAYVGPGFGGDSPSSIPPITVARDPAGGITATIGTQQRPGAAAALPLWVWGLVLVAVLLVTGVIRIPGAAR